MSRDRTPLSVSAMTKQKSDSPEVQAAALSITERLLLFCVASNTEWQKAGIPGTTITIMIAKGLIDRDPASELCLTKDGRAVFKALVAGELE
jgi:hypothetical protein